MAVEVKSSFPAVWDGLVWKHLYVLLLPRCVTEIGRMGDVDLRLWYGN